MNKSNHSRQQPKRAIPGNLSSTARLAARLHRCTVNWTPRLLVFLACSLLMVLAFPRVSAVAHAAQTGAGHITGQLLNGSHNKTPVANQSVTLQMAQGNSSRDLVTITTDAQGRYSFGALQSDTSVQYSVYTLYQGAQYFTDLIDLSKNPNAQMNLTVYDATSSITNLAVVQATILIDKPNAQSGMLTVTEDFFFENLGTTTYVGSLDASQGKPNALLFSLPSNARFLSLGTGFDGYNSVQVNTGFASTAAVQPGTSRFSFSFQISYSGSSTQFSYSAVYPTVELSLLTPINISTDVQGLTPKGPTNTQSGTYQMFSARTLAAHKSVTAQLGGLPVPIKATAQQNSTNLNLLWLVALLIVLLLLAGVGGYIYNARRHKAASARNRPVVRKNTIPTSAKKAQATRETLLQEMLELDKNYEAGKIKKAAYQDQRARLKARLRTLLNEQPEQRTEAAGKAARGSGKGEK
jgi:5-hydroxyisourate hydrolase-like protein (transthyretin family)